MAAASSPTGRAASTTTIPPSTTTPGRWSPCPGHWRSDPAFADSDGPVVYRTVFNDPGAFGPGHERRGRRAPPHLARARRHLLHERRLARRHLPRRHRGLLLPAPARDHRAGRGPVRARAGRRGGVRAAVGSPRQAQPDRRCSRTGDLARPRLEPGRHLAPGATRAVGPGPRPPLAGALPRGHRPGRHPRAARRARHGRGAERRADHQGGAAPPRWTADDASTAASTAARSRWPRARTASSGP